MFLSISIVMEFPSFQLILQRKYTAMFVYLEMEENQMQSNLTVSIVKPQEKVNYQSIIFLFISLDKLKEIDHKINEDIHCKICGIQEFPLKRFKKNDWYHINCLLLHDMGSICI